MILDGAKIFGYFTAMNAEKFGEWRERCGLTQERAAERFQVTRATIQNWESGATQVPAAVAQACKVWERRLRQENPELGPVTLVYTDAPMWMDPYGPRRIAMLQQEPFRTNSAALGRVVELWGDPKFHSPLIVTEDNDVLWNAVELDRVARQQDPTAPTPARWRGRVIKDIANYLSKIASRYPVRSGPELMTDGQLTEIARVGAELAQTLERLAEELPRATVTRRDVEAVLERGKERGLFPAASLASELARAFA